MPLNLSGPISLAGPVVGQSIAVELGQSPTGQISLNDSIVRGLAKVPSGTIVMPVDFWGKADTFIVNILANTNNLDLRTAAVAAGWDGVTNVSVVISAGLIIGSISSGSPAVTVSGSFPDGVRLINNGNIVGLGGVGGAGGSSTTSKFSANPGTGSPGAGGGTALSAGVALTVINNGVIAGGGGGGGGGGGAAWPGGTTAASGGGGGGGGRTNIINVSGGAGGSASGGTFDSPGSSGGLGVYSGQGSGGAGGAIFWQGLSAVGGAGGSGGNWGSSGGAGANGSGTNATAPGGAGGGAGSCTLGSSNITWEVSGTRLGPLN